MKNGIRKVLSVMLIVAMAFSTLNITKADESTLPAEEKYADILGLYKTVDETIEMLIERADNDELGERTYFIKSEDETLDTSWWSNIVDKCCGENIGIGSYAGEYDFRIGNDYYYSVTVRTYRSQVTSDHKKEYEEKVKYIEESLGLFSEEMCDYEKAAIIFKHIVDNVYYSNDGTYKGQAAYDALIDGTAVCGGYARIYNSMLADVGINSLWITSNECANPHAWNLVQLGDKWYFCDPTASYVMPSNNEYIYLAAFMLGNVEDAEIPAHEIDTDSYSAISYYNCNVSEENMRTGDDGQESVDVSLSKIHNYTAPTCTSTGVFDIECDYCNDRHEITIPITHYYTYTTTTEPTCLEEGSGTATCTLCGDTYDYTIPAEGHKWTYRSVKADCETDGYEKVYCEDCNEVYWIEETPAYIHDWSEWVESSQMTYKRTCSKCKEEQIELKTVIDGVPETTTVYIPEEYKEAKDRGYGIVAYYSEDHGYWLYVDERFGPAYLDGETGVWVESLGEYVIWDEVTHTFKRIEELSTTEELNTTEQGSETETSTSVVPATTTTTTEPTTTPADETTSDMPATNNGGQKPTEPNVTAKAQETSVAEKTTAPKPVKPGKVRISGAKNNKRKTVKLTWKRIKNAKKYQIQYSLSATFKKGKKYKTTTKTTKKLKLSIRKLKKRKTYYFRVRAVNGNVYGKWSKKKKVKIKK